MVEREGPGLSGTWDGASKRDNWEQRATAAGGGAAGSPGAENEAARGPRQPREVGANQHLRSEPGILRKGSRGYGPQGSTSGWGGLPTVELL